jgi:phosphatidylglycerophosphate synthase
MAVISVTAAIFFLIGTKSLLIAGSILFIFAMVLDHTDGDVARATQIFSKKGIFLDHIHHTSEEMFTFVGLGIYVTKLTSNFNFFLIGIIISTLIVTTMYFGATMWWVMKRESHYDLKVRKLPFVLLYGNFFKVWHFLVLFSVIFNFADIVIIVALIWSIAGFIPRMHFFYKECELFDKEHNYKN